MAIDVATLGPVIQLIHDVETACVEGEVPEEVILQTHVLAIAMRIHSEPEAEREAMYVDLVTDVRDHVDALSVMEQVASEKTGIPVDVLRATLLGV